jgi:hypothetical protein
MVTASRKRDTRFCVSFVSFYVLQHYVAMGLDTTSLGMVIFFMIIMPGAVFVMTYRWVAGYKDKMGEFSSLVAAALFGLILFAFWQYAVHNDMGRISQALATPLSAGLGFSISGFIFAILFGIPVRWFRSKLRL